MCQKGMYIHMHACYQQARDFCVDVSPITAEGMAWGNPNPRVLEANEDDEDDFQRGIQVQCIAWYPVPRPLLLLLFKALQIYGWDRPFPVGLGKDLGVLDRACWYMIVTHVMSCHV